LVKNQSKKIKKLKDRKNKLKIKNMNKKIIISLGIIGLAAAIAIGATTAFFSDTETSTGNTFTAGSIDLKIDSTAHYNGMVCVGNKWQAELNYTPVANQYPVPNTDCTGSFGWKDLTSGDKFFNYVDVKPGDMGENTISMHVINNDAWACMKVNNLTSIDNGFTEPEQVVDTNTAKGELDETMYVFGWLDTNGDNIYQSSEITLFGPGKAMDVLNNKTYTIADSITGTPLTGDPTGVTPYHVGMQWCAGTMSYNPSSGKLVCDGATMGNAAQTDIMTADVVFDVVQSRNNTDFRCVPQLVCDYSVVATGAEYGSVPLYGATVTPVLVTNTDCTTVNALKIEKAMNFQQNQPAGNPAGWAGWSCLEPGYFDAIGGGVIPANGTIIAQGLAETGAPAIDGHAYPVYPNQTFPVGEEGWVVEAAGSTPPTSIYVLCAQ